MFRGATALELKYGRELTYDIGEEPDPDMRRVIEEEGARPTSLISVHQPRTRDPLHDLQLLRDLKFINDRTVKEWGPLPKGGLPVQEKRKPTWSRPNVSTTDDHGEKDESMKLTHLAAAALSVGTLAGCTDPNHPARNPHPTQRYEVTITTDAPGPWDAVKASISYEVTNLQCTPEGPVFIGGHTGVPLDQWEEIEVTRVGDNTWRGYFYPDLLRDEDYYGHGVCHWDGTQVAPNLMAHGVRFGSYQMVNEALERPQVEFYRKSDFLDRLPKPYGVRDFVDADPEYIKTPDDFFAIAVTVKEAKP